jgi:hypothetical protein
MKGIKNEIMKTNKKLLLMFNKKPSQKAIVYLFLGHTTNYQDPIPLVCCPETANNLGLCFKRPQKT